MSKCYKTAFWSILACVSWARCLPQAAKNSEKDVHNFHSAKCFKLTLLGIQKKALLPCENANSTNGACFTHIRVRRRVGGGGGRSGMTISDCFSPVLVGSPGKSSQKIGRFASRFAKTEYFAEIGGVFPGKNKEILPKPRFHENHRFL